MHPSAHIVLSGIEACRRYLRQHPGQPVKAVNCRFDYADAAEGHADPAPREGGERRWIELRPHTAGIAIQLVDGPHRVLANDVLYPIVPEAAAVDCGSSEHPGGPLWLGIDPAAITAPPFLAKLTAAAARALEQLNSSSFPEPLHG